MKTTIRFTIVQTIVQGLLLLLWMPFVDADVAFCGDCWCAIGADGAACPIDDMPRIDFPQDWIDNLLSMTHENPMSLDCDIYTEANCDTLPALEEGGACVAEIIPSANGLACPQEYSYRLKTVSSREEAERNLQLVTHDGACGTCSSFQDLSVYLSSKDLSSIGIDCAFRALIDVEDGTACYMEAGFSQACALTWLYNSFNTNRNCPMCVSHALSSAPPNLAAPNCDLADCIACDEEKSGPAFVKYAGRTRRNSGLLSAIIRSCDEVGTLIQRDPCDDTPLTAPPTFSPTTSPPSTPAPAETEPLLKSSPSGSTGAWPHFGFVGCGMLQFLLLLLL